MKNNFYIIAPEDPTLDFLSPVYSDEYLKPFIGGGLIKVKPSEEGYEDVKEQVSNIPQGALILFLGHGTSRSLLGGASLRLEKKCIWDLSSMSSFQDKYLVLLACNSASLLKSSRASRNNCDSVGFELLPTDMGEVASNKHLVKLDLVQADIDQFKTSLVEIFSTSFRCFFQYGSNDLIDLVRFLRILIDRKIMALAHSSENRKVADIFVLMRSGIAMH